MEFLLPQKEKYRVHLLALGDVGGTLLLGLKLLGADILSSIGIFDMREGFAARYEQEMNQISQPFVLDELPEVEIITQDTLFDCDVFLFCASAAVPEVGAAITDVRMAQLESNANIIKKYARIARDVQFHGLFAVVSDPVDLLCQCAYYESNKNELGDNDEKGLLPGQIRGYGLGVMHARALYFAKREPCYASYRTEGRAFGPHGEHLILANSIENYDDILSLSLSRQVAEANLSVRKLGFKPYLAPAISSAALPLLLTLRGEWHYSAIFQNNIYFGCKNRLTPQGTQTEVLNIPLQLQWRIDAVQAYLYTEGARWR